MKPAEDQEILLLVLSPDEAQELFNRCLRSQEDDTPASSSALRKLGDLVSRNMPQETSFRRAA